MNQQERALRTACEHLDTHLDDVGDALAELETVVDRENALIVLRGLADLMRARGALRRAVGAASAIVGVHEERVEEEAAE